MKKVLYISSLPKESQTGGANAVNYHIYKQLENYFECSYVQINPPSSFFAKWSSKVIRKIIKRPGRFDFYSAKRLNKIKSEFQAIEGDYDVIFFRGFTPWIHCEPKQPFVAYNDVHFKQFFENTFSYKHFLEVDLERIFNSEKRWLSKANRLYFESTWGLESCRSQYPIDKIKMRRIGRGGNVPLPLTDVYSGGMDLVIIANNFYQKGGDLVFEAFQALKKKFPELELHVIGCKLEQAMSTANGVISYGKLNKENPDHLNRLITILSKAFLLMHPTREDTNPLVATEAGYFGCPCITVDHFALPELVLHNETGVLLPYLPSPEQIEIAVEHLITNKGLYLQMRKRTWEFNHLTFSWDKIGQILRDDILKII